jgi:hypothetical protein
MRKMSFTALLGVVAALLLGVAYAQLEIAPGQSGTVTCTACPPPAPCPHPAKYNVKTSYQGKPLCLACHEDKSKTLIFSPFDTEGKDSGHRKHLQKRDPFTTLNISCRTCHSY